MVIKNGKDISLSQKQGGVPNMSSTLNNWMQLITFTVVVKTIVNSRVLEVGTDFSFRGVWQPFSSQQLNMKPEGQRAWKWFTVHAPLGVTLAPDMVIKYQGTQYRVKDRLDYELYGYNEFHLIQDSTGSGPKAA